MSFVHGKDTVISLDGHDLSVYVTSSQLESNADSHDVTTYGRDSHVRSGGLLDSKVTMSGIYDNSTSNGPSAVVLDLVGTVVPLVRKPEGTGAGKPTQTVQVLVQKFVETNPVADMVTWSCDMEGAGDLVLTTQT